MKKQPGGQIIIGAIVVLVLLAIIIPSIIVYIQNESKWTVKEQRTTRAFQLAEAAVERGFQKVIQSTTVWNSLQAGTPIAGFNFDQTYSDIPGGDYEIQITNGPGTQAATVTGVARDSSTNEIRTIRSTFGNSASNAAIFAEGGITLASNPGVEWGPVMSPNVITTDHIHPRFYSSSAVSLDPNGPVLPNSDNKQWWSYYPNLPPAPQIDVQAYLTSATLQGHVYPGGTYNMKNDICGGASSCTGIYYFGGDTVLKAPAAWVSNGAIIVDGNFTMQGDAGAGAPAATIPPNAWKEYGNDWATYQAYDVGAPASFPGINGVYTPGALTYTLDKTLVHGFLYVKNSMSITGGGNMSIWGSMYIGDATTLNGSRVKIYYDDSLVIWTKNVTLVRTSWQELNCPWSSTHPSCP